MRRAWTHWGTSQHFAALRLPTHDGGTRLEVAVIGGLVGFLGGLFGEGTSSSIPSTPIAQRSLPIPT